MADFDEILNNEEPTATEETQPQEEATTEEQPQEAAETPEPEAPAPEEPTVPLAVFKSMRDDLKTQIDQVKSQLTPQRQPEPVKAPDMFEQPEQYQQFVSQQIQGARTSTKLEMSRFMAEREFGKEAVDEVVQYFDQNPQLSHQFVNEPSPFHAAKAYVDAQRTAQEIGNDPAAYKAKMEAEIRAKIEAEMAAKQAQDMAAKAAPSLANTNGTGGKTDPGWSGPTPLESLIGE